MMSGTLFILGNGFDLDLGLKTSYIDYLSSEEFRRIGKNKCECKNLADFLFDLKIRNENDEHFWFDLEQGIGDYYNSLLNPQQSTIGNFINKYDKTIFLEFLKSINDFILKASNVTLTLSEKRAFFLTKHICDLYLNNYLFDIYTFNYTSEIFLIPFMNQFLNGKKYIGKDKIYSIHGNVTESFNAKVPPIVVGTSDSYLQNMNTGFVKKSNQNAKMTGRFHDNILNNYNQFVIFGHSLGEMDHSYFIPIFENTLRRNDNPEFIFFTKEGGENNIRDQISKMLNINIDKLTNTIDLKINYDIKDVLKSESNRYSLV
jgi:hypothetical protein